MGGKRFGASPATRFVATALLAAAALSLLLAAALPASAANEPSPPTLGRDIVFENLTAEQGLEDERVFRVIQDRRGFIWAATGFGLHRFDGNGFTVYVHDAGVPTSLGQNLIWTLMEDDAGHLWIASWGGGVDRFDPATERFDHFRHDADSARSLSSDRVWALLEDSRGTVWVATDEGLNRFEPQTGDFVRYRHRADDPASLANDSVTAIAEDGAGNLWLATYGGGLERFDPTSGVFSHYRHDDDDPGSLASDTLWTVYVDGHGDVWAGTEAGLDRLEAASGDITHYRSDPGDPDTLSHDTVTSLFEDSRGILWAGTLGGGLNRRDRGSDRFRRYRHAAGDSTSLAGDTVWGVTEDDTGRLWIATEGGISRVDPLAPRITRFRGDTRAPDTPAREPVTALFEDDRGRLWLGTGSSGVYRLDADLAGYVHYRARADDANSLASNKITDIVADTDGTLWIATNGGLNRLDPASGQITRYRHDADDPTSLPHDSIKALAVDAEGTLWLAGFGGGLMRLDAERRGFRQFTRDPDNPGAMTSEWLLDLALDADGSIWAAAAGGLLHFDPRSETFEDLRGKPLGFADRNVRTLFRDRHDNLWIGTDAGLFRHQPGSGELRAFGTRDGLASDLVSALTEDDAGHLWISTGRGISRLDPDSGVFRNYDRRDGLLNNQFQPRAVFRRDDGRMLFGAARGFEGFAPHDLPMNPYPPPVVLTGLAVFHEPVAIGADSPLARAIDFMDAITLTHEQSTFSIAFAALDYRAPAKVRYAYRLEGIDRDWVRTDSTRRVAAYTNIGPGRYRFSVRAANADGVWNETGRSLLVVVTPAWWQTWWFYTLSVLSVATLLALVYRSKARQLALEKRLTASLHALNVELDEKVRQRTAALTAANEELEAFSYTVAHDLRAPLRGIEGLGRILREDHAEVLGPQGSAYLERLLENCERMSLLIEKLLQLSHLTRKPLREERVNLSAQALAARRSLEQHEPERHVEWHIAEDVEVHGDAALLSLVMQNLLQNAWKFSRGRDPAHIEFGVTEIDGARVCFVRDDGVGFDMAQADRLFNAFQRLHDTRQYPGTGIGLATVQRIVQRHGGRAWAEGETGHGATFYFTL